MYAVVSLKHSLVNIVIPANWIDGVEIHKFANDGCFRSCPFKIFYSKDERKKANFALMIKDYYEQLDSDSCYIAYLRKYFGKIVIVLIISYACKWYHNLNYTHRHKGKCRGLL